MTCPYASRKERESSPESEYRTLPSAGAGTLTSRRSSGSSGAEPLHVAPDRERFARDTSHYWYKPSISRDDAISALLPLEEGSFIVRNSNSFPGAFGLSVRAGNGGVRHFLIQWAAHGVRLGGFADEPVFSSLSALVYQHTVTPLALPVPLRLPDRDPWSGGNTNAAARALLATGTACHVLLLGSENTEALIGPAAIKRAVTLLLQKRGPAHVVHFKVFGGGITLTDAARKLFFRRHYPSNGVSYAGIDPDERRYIHVDNGTKSGKRIFAFVARSSSGADNQCHVLAELEPEQPTTAIVNYVNMGSESRLREAVRAEATRAETAEAALAAAERGAAEARRSAAAASAGATQAASDLATVNEQAIGLKMQLELAERHCTVLEEKCTELSGQVNVLERELQVLRPLQSTYTTLQRQYTELQERVATASEEARREASRLEMEIRRVERSAAGGGELRERARLAAAAHARERRLAAAELQHTARKLRAANAEISKLSSQVAELQLRFSHENIKTRVKPDPDEESLIEVRSALEAERVGTEKLEKALQAALADNATLAAQIHAKEITLSQAQPAVPTASSSHTNICPIDSFLAD